MKFTESHRGKMSLSRKVWWAIKKGLALPLAASIILSIFNQPGYCTTIAWDGRYLACDTQMTGGGHRKTNCATKIWYSADRKAYMGAAGTVTDILKARKWFLDPKSKDEEKADIKGDIEILIVYEDGRVHFFSDDMSKEPVEIDDCFALGSGGDFALAAMACGKDAGEAVEVASELDIFTNSHVRKFEVIKPNHFKSDELPLIEVPDCSETLKNFIPL